MSTNLTIITILVTVIHVVALGFMIWFRVHRTEADGVTHKSADITQTVTPCAVRHLITWATTGSTRTRSMTRTQAGPGPPTWRTIGPCAPLTDERTQQKGQQLLAVFDVGGCLPKPSPARCRLPTTQLPTAQWDVRRMVTTEGHGSRLIPHAE